MAFILNTGVKENKFGDEYAGAYACVDSFLAYDKVGRIADICLYYFKDQATRTDYKNGVANNLPFATEIFRVDGADFDTYFSASAITADDNQFHQAYEYLKVLTGDARFDPADWTSDE